MKRVMLFKGLQQALHPYRDYKLKDFKKAWVRRLKLPVYRGTAYSCPVCDVELKCFKPIYKSFLRKLEQYGFVYPVSSFETLNLAAYSCPSCDASDRDRLYAVYLERRFEAMDRAKVYKFVDFAPSLPLSCKLRKSPFLNYRSADLYRKTADDRVDITGMTTYPNASVDFFLCSHILEHIADDQKAMRELYRILKPGGFGIIMVPIITGLEDTHEDPSITTPEQRWKYFGQDDHVRQYSREGKNGFVPRLKHAGFTVYLHGVEHFGIEKFKKHGIAENSVLYVVEK